MAALSAAELSLVLLHATAPDARRLALANAQLEQWEQAEPGIWARLLDVAFDAQLPLDAAVLAHDGSEEHARRAAVRSMAIIRFKNGIDRHWRSRVAGRGHITIPAEEKANLRSRLWACLDEQNKTIALQTSIAITRIARYDYPTAWPTLFDELTRSLSEAHAVQSSSAHEAERDHARLKLLRGADVLQRVLKELGTVRLLAGKIRMTELAKAFLPQLHYVFQRFFVETFPSSPDSMSEADLASWASTPALADRVRTSQLLLRAVMHLVLADPGLLTTQSASEGGASQNMAMQVFAAAPAALSCLSNTRLAYLRLLRRASGEEQQRHLPLLTNLTKHVLAFGKLFVALIGRERSQASRWSGWSDVAGWYWATARSASSDTTSVARDSATSVEALTLDQPPRFVVQALVLLKLSLSNWKQAPPAPFNSREFFAEVVDVLVGRLMRLTPDDLARWEADPEDFVKEEQSEAIDLDIRPAAERLLMLAARYSQPPHLVGELLWTRFEEAAALPVGDIDAVLQRDAVYAAVGRCREYLSEDAKALIAERCGERLAREAMLGPEGGSSWVIVRRRVAWLFWEWSELVTTAHRPAVYAALVSLLEDHPGITDLAVRLEAARSLGALADSLEFDADAFEPHIEAALGGLARLVAASELQAVDSIRTCTTSLSVLTERLGARITPYVETLVALVPALWAYDDPQFLSKSSILSFVGKMLHATELVPYAENGPAVRLHAVVEPMVRYSVTDQSASPMIGKDALLLWIRALHSAPQITPALFSLIDLLPTLLEQRDFCAEASRACTEYALLCPVELCTQHGASLFGAFASILSDPTNPAILCPVSTLDSLLQSLAAHGVAGSYWPQLADASNVFALLIGTLLQVKESPVIAGHIIALLARMAVQSADRSFLALIRSAAPKLGHSAGAAAGTGVVLPLVQEWCERFENMASARRRKITCLGLAAMLRAARAGEDPEVFEAVPNMVALWSDAMSEFKHEPRGGNTHRSASPPLVALSDDEDDLLEDTAPGAARANALAELDPAYTSDIGAAVSAALNDAQAQAGPDVFSDIDGLVLDLLRADLAQN